MEDALNQQDRAGQRSAGSQTGISGMPSRKQTRVTPGIGYLRQLNSKLLGPNAGKVSVSKTAKTPPAAPKPGFLRF